MTQRGKAVASATYNPDNNIKHPEFTFSSADLPCLKHPSLSSVGVCAHCVSDRLVKLVCSDCGENRLSSCSCFFDYSTCNFSNVVEVGSVGIISSLVEKERFEIQKPNKSGAKSANIRLLKRSGSSHGGEVKKSRGFWKWVFRKRRDGKSDMSVTDCIGMSRSRSMCSFRDPYHQGTDLGLSSAKISDFDQNQVMGYQKKCDFDENQVLGYEKRSVFDEDGAKISGYDLPKRSVFPFKESGLSFDEMGVLGSRSFGFVREEEGHFGDVRSCKIDGVDDRGVKRGKRGTKLFKWIFMHHFGLKSLKSN